MSLFSYKTGVWPISLEIAGARMTLNQDGSVGLMLGATEIGQGADTAFSQMTAEVLNMDISEIHIQSVQDTDVTPFDTGAYASRQSFVTGTVVKDCANLLKEKILAYARQLMPEETRELSLDHGWIMAGEDQAMSHCKSCCWRVIIVSQIHLYYSRSFGTGEEEYHCYRMLFRRSRSGHRAWQD